MQTSEPNSAARPQEADGGGRMPLRTLMQLLGLTFASFIFNTSEFIPIGLLSDIRADFGLTEATVGLLISVYAWVVMVMSLPLMIWVSRFELRRLMLGLLLLFAVCHVGSYLSASYGMLMASRVGVALAHSVFWSILSPMAVRMVSERYRQVALSMVVCGSSVALILGMPLGRVVGLHLGWRITFLSIGVFAFITLIYCYFLLPVLPSRGRFSVRRLPALFARRELSGAFLFTMTVSTAYYICYSYIEPFLKQVGGMSEGLCTATLMVYGLAGFVGSLVFSRYYARSRRGFMTVMIVLMSVCLFAVWPASLAGVWPAMAVCFVWGMSVTAYNVSMQSNVILVSPREATSVSMSIFSGIYNFGIGFGALIGGMVCTHLSISLIGVAGGVLCLAGLAYWVRWLGSRL